MERNYISPAIVMVALVSWIFYVSELDSHGEWGKAVNLGNTINTSGNEDSPFIHFDGVTLYFSSDGHPGLATAYIFL